MRYPELALSGSSVRHATTAAATPAWHGEPLSSRRAREGLAGVREGSETPRWAPKPARGTTRIPRGSEPARVVDPPAMPGAGWAGREVGRARAHGKVCSPGLQAESRSPT